MNTCVTLSKSLGIVCWLAGFMLCMTGITLAWQYKPKEAETELMFWQSGFLILLGGVLTLFGNWRFYQ